MEALELQIEAEDIADNEVVFGGGLGADSTATFEVVFAVEETFEIEVGDEDLRADLLDSVSRPYSYVKFLPTLRLALRKHLNLDHDSQEAFAAD